MNTNDPLHGITLEALLNQLVDTYGWETLHGWVRINCFKSNPSIKSSLTFLRRTPWARELVETIFIGMKAGDSNEQLKKRLQGMQKSDAAKKPSGVAKVGPADKKTFDPWNKNRS